MVMRAATASWASGPAAETVTCWPLVAPRPITPSTLLASAVWEPAFHLGRAGPEVAVVGAPGRDDRPRAAADLRGQVRRARGEFGAMRDEDDSDGGSGHGIS